MNVVVVPMAARNGDGKGNAAADLASCADRVLRLFSREGERVADSGKIEIGEKQYTLDLAGRGAKSFTIRVPTPGRYAIFTQHTAEEFALRLEDTAGRRLRPVEVRDYAAGHTHDDTITSVGIELEGEVDEDKFNRWLGKLLREGGVDIFRSKGILNIKGDANRFVFQIASLSRGAPGSVCSSWQWPWGRRGPVGATRELRGHERHRWCALRGRSDDVPSGRTLVRIAGR
jgi:hypothetical protein